MKRIFRILPLAMALGALSALGGASSSGERPAGRGSDTDVAARGGDSSVVSSALVRLSTTALPTHAMPADMGVAYHAPALPARHDGRLTCGTLSLASRPLFGAATPRAPAH